MSDIGFERYKTGIGLLLLTSGALLVHGYHPFAEDAEIYLPGVEKILHPELFPVGREFFAAHASLTLFPNLVAFSLRVTHSADAKPGCFSGISLPSFCCCSPAGSWAENVSRVIGHAGAVWHWWLRC